MTVAEKLQPLVDATIGTDLPLRVECWDGSSLGPAEAKLTVRFGTARALRRLMWAPNELGFARAYVSGDIELEGDLLEAMSALGELSDPERGPTVAVGRQTVMAIGRAVLGLGTFGAPPAPPPEEARLAGRLHSRRRDATAIRHHYDVGNEFYRIVLGPSLVYSCAYFEQEPSESFGVDEAQRAKLDHVARKLQLEPGMRVLDVGCGWGSFVLHAAREYGAHAVGVTLSREQAALARERVAAEGLAGLVEIRVQDYRDIDDGPYDAIASIGMAEHVGRAKLPTYAADLYRLLRPGGRLLNHAISRRPGPRERGHDRTSFISRYVFPDGELVPLADMVGLLEEAGFEVRDVESLREHYARTLRAWIANLEGQWDRAIELTSPGRAKVWRLYMAGSALAFEANRIGINQVIAVRTSPAGQSGMPPTRQAFA